MQKDIQNLHENNNDLENLIKLAHKISNPWKFCSAILAILLIYGTYQHFCFIKTLNKGKIIIEQTNSDTISSDNIVSK